MRRLALALAGMLLLAAPVPAAAHVTVGVGEQTPAMFGDARFEGTGIRNARLIVPYDVVRTGGRFLRWTDAWLDLARARGIEPLVTFRHSNLKRKRWRVPSVREYAARVSEFLERYPWVHEYSTWNEANHKYIEPTGLYPVRTAALYRALRRQCAVAGCQVVAADILVTGSRRTWRWLRAFRLHMGGGYAIWGLQNYPDANRLSTYRTRQFLHRVRGEVWFTETGGIVKFSTRWHRNEQRAARAVRQVFRLASLSPRIKRVYLYNWRADPGNRRWDSGLISPTGRARPGYSVLLDFLSLDRFRPLAPLLGDSPIEEPALPPS